MAKYPWVAQERDKLNEVPAPLSDIEFETGDRHQVPCEGCGAAPDTTIEFTGRGNNQCDHPVAYVENQLIVSDVTFDAFGATDITPALIAEEGEDSYTPIDGYRLYEINMDPIDALIQMASDPATQDIVASPNYLYPVAPKWKFGPGDTKVMVDPLGQVAQPLFKGSRAVIVVDDFGSSGTEVSGHGEFIVHLLERLIAEPTVVTRPVALSDTQGNLWQRADEFTIAAAARSGAIAAPDGVLNLSLGTYPCTTGGLEFLPTLLRDELLHLNAEYGISVVAAAGNDGHDPEGAIFYPAGLASELDFVHSVGAAGWSPSLEEWVAADFANVYEFSTWAPGVAIVSEINGQGYAWSGSSFAAPHFAALLSGDQGGS